MPSTNELLQTFVAMVATYLVCGIPFGLLIARRGGVADVRKVGSGNIGTTNVARTVGKGAAALTLLCDAGKGFAAVAVARVVLASTLCGGDAAMLAPPAAYGWVMGCMFLAAILGHVFSPYLHFRGGKGIAVGFGAALAFVPMVALGLLATFAVVVLPSRLVSAASVTAAVSLPIWCVVLYGATPATLAPVLIVSATVVWAHRTNIAKLARGEERRFSFHKSEPSKGRGAYDVQGK